MNNLSKMFIALAASSMMFSCSNNDEPGVQTPVKGDLYTTLTLSLPQGGRSATVDGDDNTNSDAGYENGQDRENNVGSVLVVLAQKSGNDYTYVTSNLADAHASTGNQTRPTYNIQFETRELYELEKQEVYVFAYCNPTSDLVNAAKNKFADQGGFIHRAGNIDDASIWMDNGFLMTNAITSTTVLPSKEEMDQKYNTPANPFNLGTIKVERAAVRFDFEQTQIDNYDANLYPIYNHQNAEFDENGNPVVGENQLMGFVQLDGMALLNQAKNYYYLPRVSNNGLDAGAEICGRETPNNFVVSPNAQQKIADQLDVTWLRANYDYNALPAQGAVSGLVFTNLTYDAMGTNLGDDDDANWKPGVGSNYKIWRYTTENTIPDVNLSGVNHMQRVGVTTGIVFRGHLVAASATSDLGKVINAGTQTIYGFNGILYGNLEMLKKAVKANPVSSLAETFKTAYGLEEITDETLAGVTADLTVSKGFTLYEPTNGKYYMYYTYLNRHNDNGNNTVMAPMEFSVVRNNVYKIKVQNVLEFGHPGDPSKDPDPEDPDDPDETPKTYFRVQVQVLPWVVRVNNIIL